MLSRHLKEGCKKNPSASPLVGFQSILASAEGGTIMVGLPLPTRLPPGLKNGRGIMSICQQGRLVCLSPSL